MKKTAVFFFLLIITLRLFSQEANNTNNVQPYETLSWQAVDNARKYQIVIETLLDDGTWKKVLQKQTSSTSYKAELKPGHYRMAVSAYNILGKKSATSEWTEFKVIDSAVPYFFENYLAKSKLWNSPLLSLEETEDEDSIKIEQIAGNNAFFIKGKNIFSSDTTFFLVPEKDSSKKGRSFEAFNEKRPSVQLKAVQINEKNSGVYLSFDSRQLYSGYYLLEARRNGGTVSTEILVLADHPLELEPSGFEVDTRYKVNSITMDNSAFLHFSAEGNGFSGSTEFFMEPSTGAVEYIYASELERKKVPLSLAGKQNLDDSGRMHLDFNCNTEDLKSGYYNVVARNSEQNSARFLILVKPSEVKNVEEQINKIKSKYNKKTKMVDFIITSDGIKTGAKFTLVSEYSQDIGDQVRLPLYFRADGKNKFSATIPADSLIFGDYMLLVESEDSTSSQYFSIDNHYSLSSRKFGENEIASKFQPKENDADAFEVTLDTADTGVVSFDNFRVNVFPRYPKIMPFLRPVGGFDDTFFGYQRGTIVADSATVQMSANSNDVDDTDDTEEEAASSGETDYYGDEETTSSKINSDLRLQFDVFNIDWFAIGLNVKFNPNMYDNKSHIDLAPEFTMKFLLNEVISPAWNYFTPYLGAGIGYNVLDHNHSTPFYNFDHDLYAFAFAGFTLFKLYELSYHIEYHNIQNQSNSYLKLMQFNFGVRVPIRRQYYDQQVLAKKAVIEKEGIVNAADYEGLKNELIEKITIADGALAVGGMSGYKNINIIELPSSLVEINADAFKDCTSLKNVSIASDSKLKAIRSGSFENTTAINQIVIPASVEVIEKDAFKGWTYGQMITLPFTRTEIESKDFEGLKDIKAIINYNGLSSDISAPSAFVDYRNYVSFNGNIFQSGSYITDDKTYGLALFVHGLGVNINPKKDASAVPVYTSQSELLDSFKSGNSISFKVLGDGKKYLLFVRTELGGAFYVEFTTKKGKEKKISIDYTEFEKTSYSKVHKFKKDDVTEITFVPIYNTKLSKSLFYDFEVK